MNDQKNLILAAVLSLFVVFGYFTFIEGPAQQRARADALKTQEALKAQKAETPIEEAEPLSRNDALETITAPNAATNSAKAYEPQRIKIDAASLRGSFLTTGTRIDDIALKHYDKTLEPKDGQVELLNPEGSENAAYLMDNWTRPDGFDGENASGINTPWELVAGEVLSEDSPIKLATSIGDVRIERTLSIDDHYMITLQDKLTNTGQTNAELTRKAAARQINLPKGLTNFFIIQEGPISVVEGAYHEQKYKKLAKKGHWGESGQGGWVGLTDKYWLISAIAPQDKPLSVDYNYRLLNDKAVYESSYTLKTLTLTPGATVSSTGHMIVGPKDRGILKDYETAGIGDITNAIGWGKLKILVKPISFALSWLGAFLGNYGFGILALTLLIKILMFPLYNKQYASQAKMKKVQPKLKKLQERYKDDRLQLQKEMMNLYKTEGVNPAAGCLPIIPTIFVFFALYKSVFINIDLRHESFLGYIHDLSARDPLSILNGFGLFPWEPNPLGITALMIGPLAILYGATMSLMYTLQPSPGMGASDQAKMQAKIFKYLPWFFMFLLAGFPAGLLIYWIWNNILSFAQQYYITRKFGVDTPVDKFFRKLTGKSEPSAE